MKKSRLFSICCLLVPMVSSIVSRDPFTCSSIEQQGKNKQPEPIIVQKPEKKLPDSCWTVQERREKGVVLKDDEGNIREVSFENI